MGAGCGAGRFWDALSPLASCPAQVGRPPQHPLEWRAEEQNSHGRDGCRRRLVCAGREVKARLLPMRIVAALNARLMGRLYRIFSFVLLTNSWRRPTLLSVDAWMSIHCTGRMREGEATSPRLPAVTPRC